MAFEGLNGLIQGLEGQASWQTRRQFRQVLVHWPKAVGYVVARQTRPTSIQRQILYVAASTGAWSQTLAFERQRIVKKLNAYLQVPLKDIRFSAAQWSSKPINTPAVESDLVIRHPSYIGPQNNDSDVAKDDPHAVEKPTAYEAFKRWSHRLQMQQITQSVCPQCQCACPIGELERWSICSLCVAKSWGSNN